MTRVLMQLKAPQLRVMAGLQPVPSAAADKPTISKRYPDLLMVLPMTSQTLSQLGLNDPGPELSSHPARSWSRRVQPRGHGGSRLTRKPS